MERDSWKAYQEIYQCNEEGARVGSFQLLQDLRIQAQIDKEKRVLPEYRTESAIFTDIVKLAETTKNDNVRQKALELQAKIKGMLIEKQQVKVEESVKITDLSECTPEELVREFERRFQMTTAGIKSADSGKSGVNSVSTITPAVENDALSRESIPTEGAGYAHAGAGGGQVEGKEDVTNSIAPLNLEVPPVVSDK